MGAALMFSLLEDDHSHYESQIGGSFGGFKISKSSPKLPLEVKVEMLDLSPGFINLFNSRTVLVFTGQQVRKSANSFMRMT